MQTITDNARVSLGKPGCSWPAFEGLQPTQSMPAHVTHVPLSATAGGRRAANNTPMPHYADGTPANVGDRVRGTGYNLKSADGTPKEFEGVVVHVVPNSDACNIQVAHLRRAAKHTYGLTPTEVVDVPESGAIAKGRAHLVVDVEYGECKAFRKLD